MPKRRFTTEQIIAKLREAEVEIAKGLGVPVACKKIGKTGAGSRTLVVASSMRVEQTMSLLRHGVRDVVIKPYTKAALAAILS